MPAVEQVKGTLPIAFRQNFPSTYAIRDRSEVFIETPSYLHMQSSTWSQYIINFLLHVDPMELCLFRQCMKDPFQVKNSHVISGFLTTLQDKPGISITADRGFPNEHFTFLQLDSPSPQQSAMASNNCTDVDKFIRFAYFVS